MLVLDLFSGIGGMSLGLDSVGFKTVAFCEVDPFCRAVLKHHWPGVPIHDDVRTLKGADVESVDLVAGGWPCQPVSVAGKRKGQADARWMWPEMLRLVREVRPRWVLAENVPGLRTLGADRVLEDLESEGYACWPLVVGACDVGAPHRRKRVWIVARKRLADGDSARESDASEPGRQQRSRGPEASDACGGGAALADGDAPGRSTERSGGLLDGERQAPGHDADGRSAGPVGEPTGRRLAGIGGSDAGALPATQALRWPARPGEPQHGWEEPRLVAHSQRSPGGAWNVHGREQQRQGDEGARVLHQGNVEQPLGSAAHGLPERLVRRANREALRALGNAVVPQVVAQIGRAILEAERSSLTPPSGS